MTARGFGFDWKRILTSSEATLDRITIERRRARARTAVLEIVPYRGFGVADRLTLGGRVLAQKRIARATDRESIWRNLLDTYQRLDSDEIPGAHIAARHGSSGVEVTTDDEGYFVIDLPVDPPVLPSQMWHAVSLDLLDPRRSDRAVSTVGHVLVPPPDAEFGIISDLDDTVIQTGATNVTRMLRNTLFHSARTRLPFEGVATFYQALHLGRGGAGRNPIFYVSSSPWNLYDLLSEFLTLQGIPDGPLMLGDFGIDDKKWIHAPHDEHKHEQIQRVLDTYPGLRFVLIGDSGQRDPEIYWEVARNDPARIIAIYIRDVTTTQRAAEVHTIAGKVEDLGVPMLLIPDTGAAAADVTRRGLIPGS